MNMIFIKILNMSISASLLILAVLIVRLVLKKSPKWISVLLWGIVAIRLLSPFSFESSFSLMPDAEMIRPELMMSTEGAANTGTPTVSDAKDPVTGQQNTSSAGIDADTPKVGIPVFSVVWAIGAVSLLAYAAFTYRRLRMKVSTAVLLRDNIYQSEHVASPFVLGIIRPKIYLPFKTDENNLNHVLAHESAHIRRKDHLWKPLGFLLLAVHWFNPLMWLAYALLCRDIELACDEKVIKGLSFVQRADYTQALLSCTVHRRMIAACPLAFGETGIKERVKSVMNYKKPAFWIVAISIAACVVVAVCFLTNPRTQNEAFAASDEDITQTIDPATENETFAPTFAPEITESAVEPTTQTKTSEPSETAKSEKPNTTAPAVQSAAPNTAEPQTQAPNPTSSPGAVQNPWDIPGYSPISSRVNGVIGWMENHAGIKKVANDPEWNRIFAQRNDLESYAVATFENGSGIGYVQYDTDKTDSVRAFTDDQVNKLIKRLGSVTDLGHSVNIDGYGFAVFMFAKTQSDFDTLKGYYNNCWEGNYYW